MPLPEEDCCHKQSLLEIENPNFFGIESKISLTFLELNPKKFIFMANYERDDT